MIFFQIVFQIIVVLIFTGNVISMDLKWKNIKKKANNILNENWNKTQCISQVGPKPSSYLDYPGFNKEKLKKNKILWDLYYACLEEQQRSVNKNKIFQAKVITTFRSLSLK